MGKNYTLGTLFRMLVVGFSAGFGVCAGTVISLLGGDVGLSQAISAYPALFVSGFLGGFIAAWVWSVLPLGNVLRWAIAGATGCLIISVVGSLWIKDPVQLELTTLIPESLNFGDVLAVMIGGAAGGAVMGLLYPRLMAKVMR